MSRQNVETVRRAYEAFNSGDLDARLEYFRADAEYDITAAIGPYAGMYHGRAAIRDFLADYLESWEFVRMEPKDVIEAGEDHVVALLRMHMRGKESGVEVEAHPVNLWTMRDGSAARIAVYNDRAAALKAVGLSEKDFRFAS
jgi:ketosteroid isomerase-like protein